MKLNEIAKKKGYDYNDPDYWDFVITEFTCGGCLALALVLHNITGWDIYAEYVEENNELLHAWVINNEGNSVDINGIHQGKYPKPKWKKPKSKTFNVKKLSGEILEKEISDYDTNDVMKKWAYEIIQAKPELFALA